MANSAALEGPGQRLFSANNHVSDLFGALIVHFRGPENASNPGLGSSAGPGNDCGGEKLLGEKLFPSLAVNGFTLVLASRRSLALASLGGDPRSKERSVFRRSDEL